VCERRVSLLVYSLSLHRHSYIGFILAFASSIHNKQQGVIFFKVLSTSFTLHSFRVTFVPLGFRLFLFQLQINKPYNSPFSQALQMLPTRIFTDPLQPLNIPTTRHIHPFLPQTDLKPCLKVTLIYPPAAYRKNPIRDFGAPKFMFCVYRFDLSFRIWLVSIVSR